MNTENIHNEGQRGIPSMEQSIVSIMTKPEDTIFQNIVNAYKYLEGTTYSQSQKKVFILDAYESLCVLQSFNNEQRQRLIKIREQIPEVIDFVNWSLQHNRLRHCLY